MTATRQDAKLELETKIKTRANMALGKMEGPRWRQKVMPDDQNKNQEIDDLKNFIKTTEASLESAKRTLAELTGESVGPASSSGQPTGVTDKIIEGVFNGENMVASDGKVFPVPANYASKSKLVVGDRLKLTVAEDGSFIFKQIGPVERRKIIGTLTFENNAYLVMAEGKVYRVLYASVTYYKAQNGDRVTLVIPSNEEVEWAALDNVIHEIPEKEIFEDNILSDSEEPETPFWAGLDTAAPEPEVLPNPAPGGIGADIKSLEPTPEVQVAVPGLVNETPIVPSEQPRPQEPSVEPISAPAIPEDSQQASSEPQATAEMDI